jgi:tetratricopeptide (TPR) repeat protein
MLLTTLPTIRWSPVAATPGARFKYRVSMYTETGELVWRMDNVTGTEMAYPAKAEALVRGETYKVVVQSGMESSEQERNVDSAFTVLAEDGVKNIRDGEEAIRKLNLPVDKTQLLIAEFYATRRLSSEAVEKLNAVAGTLREPAVLLMLGEIYASQGLFSEALKQYEDALALPQISSDTEGQALTLHAAGLSLERLGKHEAADSRFRSAVEAYRKLGDKVMVEQLRTGAKK